MARHRLSGYAEVIIGFVPYEYNVSELWTVPFAGGPPSLVLDTGGDLVASPVASPDFSQIAYLRHLPDPEIRICDANGSNDVAIETGGYARYPEWRPDGAALIFTTYDTGVEGQIVRIDPDGSNRTVLYDVTPNYVSHAAYNRDGSLIAFFDEDADEIWVIESDGSNPTKVADVSRGDVSENWLSWQHNSDVIGFGDGWDQNGGGGKFYQVDADGSNLIELATEDSAMTSDAFGSRHAWAPDDSTYFFPKFDNSGGHWTLWGVPEGGGSDFQVSPPFGIFRLPALVLGNRIYANGEDVPATTTTGIDSIAPTGGGYRVDDPNNGLLEYPD